MAKTIVEKRLDGVMDELRWLYMELYDNSSMFAELTENMIRFYDERSNSLKRLDKKRLEEPNWYQSQDIMGMMFYIDNFAGNLKGVKRKLDYLEDLGVNYIHLMPFLDNVEGKSDGGYAVADFRKVKEELGTMEDLEALTTACRKRGISVCMDFVMNHTSDEHEWAKKAKEGDGEYMSRYFFYNSREIPDQYEQTVPQVFPTTAPGNFSWCEENGHWVMTTFYPYQWDLNYGNPRVFNEMMYNFLYLANQGIDVFRVDAVPYIWKELGTDCRNRPKVHSIVRMMRLIGEVVCPGCVLLGEVVMEPQKVAPYFGTVEKPECHMLYNVTTMCTTWNTVAMRDARLLKNQLDIVYQLPKNYLFLNYLRCHDDIGWGLDFGTLSQWGMGEPAHKRFLNDYFTGKIQGSVSRGVLYNDDAVTQDARFCGTTASMCGLEAAIYERDGDKIYWAVKKILMLHAFMLSQSGIPLLYSGDEIGQLNDYSYQDDPKKAADSRYIHRGAFSWELAKLKDWDNTSQKMIYHGLQQLIRLRKDTPVFSQNADVYTYDVHDDGILGIVRTDGCQRFISLYNFADYSKTAWMEEEGEFTDLMTGDKIVLKDVEVPGNSFIWAVRSLEEDGAVASVEEAKEDESAVASVEDTKEDEGTVASV